MATDRPDALAGTARVTEGSVAALQDALGGDTATDGRRSGSSRWATLPRAAAEGAGASVTPRAVIDQTGDGHLALPVLAHDAANGMTLSELGPQLRQDLARILGERGACRRLRALKELDSAGATLFDPVIAAVERVDISETVGAVHATGSHGLFHGTIGPAVGYQGAARLQWRAAAWSGPPGASTTDMAAIEGGRIRARRLVLDPEPRLKRSIGTPRRTVAQCAEHRRHRTVRCAA
jgi:hypothetical protein